LCHIHKGSVPQQVEEENKGNPGSSGKTATETPIMIVAAAVMAMINTAPYSAHLS